MSLDPRSTPRSPATAAAPALTTAPASINLRKQSPIRTEYELMAGLRMARILRSRTQEPELDPVALHGLAGEIVRAIEPTTEASAPAMLVTLLTAVGAMIGRGGYVRVGPEPHHPVLFSLVVGRSGSGKGVSLSAVRPALAASDDATTPFLKTRVRKGFQSGEAVVKMAADLAGEISADPAEGPRTGTPPDQRMLVIESEYARVLTVAKREGSILSSILRSAWDGESLESNTRREKLVVDGAHIGVVAHVTSAELCTKLDLVEIANGFANRFLHVWSSPGQLMPKPGVLEAELLELFGQRLRRCVKFGQGVGELRRSAAFDEAWASSYFMLRLRPSGGSVFDSLTARSAPHVLRLALVYALLDEATELDVPHLHAAMAMWEYCEATVAHIWGATLGSPDLDKLHDALARAGTAGLSRTEISALYSGNRTKEQIDVLVDDLVSRGVARQQTAATGGRPRHTVFSTG